MKKPTAKQIAARKLFAARSKAGYFNQGSRQIQYTRSVDAKKELLERERFSRAGEFNGSGNAKTKAKRKKNPLTRVGLKSPSMATKKAPSKRLVSRRKATRVAPAGYYANPVEKTIAYRGAVGKPFVLSQLPFAVEQKDAGHWVEIAGFHSDKVAFDYARALARKYPGATLRVTSAAAP